VKNLFLFSLIKISLMSYVSAESGPSAKGNFLIFFSTKAQKTSLIYSKSWTASPQIFRLSSGFPCVLRANEIKPSSASNIKAGDRELPQRPFGKSSQF
jgi:hypothetical protein